MNKKILITFAGAIGSSKTPIANYLSCKLNFPVLNNDAIRTEVLEDLSFFNEEEYIKRRDERIHAVLENNPAIIYDASVDREWKNWEDKIVKAGYKIFIISLDLSKDFLVELYKIKGYHESAQRIDQFFSDHEEFVKNYGHLVNLRITDENFKNRLEFAYLAVSEWLKE
ncbi:hypothetical protein HZB93_01495 [Candidatus Falkowbacteria bacterium]|nr:hypothetical protein [Candidatus Falkowbacteria bacterium]